jgi:hypothetical protein
MYLLGAAVWAQEEVDVAVGLPPANAGMARFSGRLQGGLELDAQEQLQLQSLRAALQEQLRQIRAEVEAGAMSHDEARWQTKTALAEHRQNRSALLSSEQNARLERAYNHLKKEREGRARRSLADELALSEWQEEQLRLLLQEQQQEWRTLMQAVVPPTSAQLLALRQAQRVAFEHLLNEKQFLRLQKIKNMRRLHHGLEKVPVDTPMLLDDAPGLQ